MVWAGQWRRRDKKLIGFTRSSRFLMSLLTFNHLDFRQFPITVVTPSDLLASSKQP